MQYYPIHYVHSTYVSIVVSRKRTAYVVWPCWICATHDRTVHKLNYTEPNNWSKPIPTGQLNEVVAVLTKKVRFR